MQKRLKEFVDFKNRKSKRNLNKEKNIKMKKGTKMFKKKEEKKWRKKRMTKDSTLTHLLALCACFHGAYIIF